MTPDRSAQKTFSTQKKAEEWARHFDYARSLLNPPEPPLESYQLDDGRWAVRVPRPS